MNSSLMRVIFALVVGLILVIWPNDAANFIVIAVGILFLISGVVSLIGYMMKRSKKDVNAALPLEGVGSFLFGLWLIITPGFFTNIIMFILGFIMILAGIFQISQLTAAKKQVTVPLGFYVIPCLVLIAGIIVVFLPKESIHTIFMIIGISSLVYAASELVNMFKYSKAHQMKMNKSKVEDAKVIEEK